MKIIILPWKTSSNNGSREFIRSYIEKESGVILLPGELFTPLGDES